MSPPGEDADDRPSVDFGTEPPDIEYVAVPIIEGEVSDQSMEAAVALAKQRDAGVLLVNAVTGADQTPLELSEERLAEDRRVAREVMKTTVDSDVDVAIHGTLRVSHDYATAILNAVEAYHATAVILDTNQLSGLINGLTGSTTSRIARAGVCDVIVVNAENPLDNIASILVPIAGGPHSGLAVDIAGELASEFNAWVELLHVIKPVSSSETRAEGAELLENAEQRLESFGDVDTWLLEATDAPDAIIEQSQYYDLVVIGAPRKNRLKTLVFGSTSRKVQAEARTPVIMAHSHKQTGSLLHRFRSRGESDE